MKSLLLHFAPIFLRLKKQLKIFPSIETYEKGRPALKWSFLEQTILYSKFRCMNRMICIEGFDFFVMLLNMLKTRKILITKFQS